MNTLYICKHCRCFAWKQVWYIFCLRRDITLTHWFQKVTSDFILFIPSFPSKLKIVFCVFIILKKGSFDTNQMQFQRFFERCSCANLGIKKKRSLECPYGRCAIFLFPSKKTFQIFIIAIFQLFNSNHTSNKDNFQMY